MTLQRHAVRIHDQPHTGRKQRAACAILLLATDLICTAQLPAQTVPARQANSAKSAIAPNAKEDVQAAVRAALGSATLEGLYARTYWSLLSRKTADGFLPESLTGAYPGMFPRTVGAYALLMLETNRYTDAESTLDCVLRALRETGYTRVPRVIGRHGTGYFIEDDEAQIDAQAHIVLGWARLALARKQTAFEDRTWAQARDLLSSGTDRPYLQFGPFPSQNGLVRNVAFEHSREGRFWDTWDLLTQSFTGAALQEMIQVAKRRGDAETAALWQKRLDVLRNGVLKNMTVEREGSQTFLEMRLPDSAAGQPYLGLGWVALAPYAAGWSPDAQTLRNTTLAMEHENLKQTHGDTWMPTDGYPDGTFSNEIIGKGQAWEMEAARSANDWARVQQILQLIAKVNTPSLYMEGAWLENDRFKLSQRLSNTDLPALENAQWKVKDAGNGEQNTWFCWEIARLRRAFGMPVEPPRP